MKYVHLFVAVVLGLVLMACGGSGGGSTVSPSLGLTATPRIEAVTYLNATGLKSATSRSYTDLELQDPQVVLLDDLLFPDSFGYQDLNNLQMGEQVYFQLVSYSGTAANPVRNVLAVTGWGTTDTNSTYGTLASDSGLFQAANQETLARPVVTVMYNGQTYAAYYAIKPRQVRLRGSVVTEEATPGPISGVEIKFYAPTVVGDPASPLAVVTTVRTSVDGSFRATVPATATAFQITNATLSTSLYRSFVFGSDRFDTGSDACTAPLPTLSNGTRTIDPISITPKVAGQDAPAATGCVAP